MILLRMFFIFEGLWWQFFGALEAWIRRAFTNLWFVEVFGGFWAWFQWPLRSRKMIWIISLRMFFVFEVEVLEVLEGLILVELLCFWILVSFQPFFSFSLSLAFFQLQPLPSLLKCLRKASIYRSLGVGERHVAKSNWWHMSQPDWSAYVIAYTCEATCVIAYTCEAACVIAYTCEAVCVIAYTCWGVIGSCMTLGKFLLVSK